MPTTEVQSGATLVAARGLLFDLDGVILDSTMDAVLRWRAFSARHGFDEREILTVAHGQRTVDTIAAYMPAALVASETQWFETLDVSDGEINALPGAKELLASLPRDSWCIVTSCPRNLAIERLERLGIRVPAVLVGAEDVPVGKPSPVPYLAGLDALGVTAPDALVFEDAPSGISSGVAAGARVVALLTTHERSVLAGTYYVTDLSSVSVVDSTSHALVLAIARV